jgi:hypothetical protein
MKLIDVSRQKDCLLAGRRNRTPLQKSAFNLTARIVHFGRRPAFVQSLDSFRAVLGGI